MMMLFYFLWISSQTAVDSFDIISLMNGNHSREAERECNPPLRDAKALRSFGIKITSWFLESISQFENNKVAPCPPSDFSIPQNKML